MAFDASTYNFSYSGSVNAAESGEKRQNCFGSGICCLFTQFESSLVRDRYAPLRLLGI